MIKDRKNALGIFMIGTIVLFPLWIFFNATNPFPIIIQAIGSLASLLTLLLAFLLFNKFGLEQRLLNKQFEIVCDLIEEISKSKFTIKSTEHTDRNPSVLIFFSPRFANRLLKNGEPYEQKLLIADTYVNAIKPIEALYNNLLMPPEIAKHLENVIVEIIDQTEGYTLNDYSGRTYFVVTADHAKCEEKYDLLGKLNQKEMNIKEFAQHWQNIIGAVEGWLQKNASLPIELNK